MNKLTRKSLIYLYLYFNYKTFRTVLVEKIKNWIQTSTVVEVDYPDNTEEIINNILFTHGTLTNQAPVIEKQYTVKRFRKLILKKIIAQL